MSQEIETVIFGKKTAPVNIIWFSVISGCLNIPNTLEKDEIHKLLLDLI